MNPIYQKIIKTLLLASPFFLIIIFSLRNIFDFDIWMHLKTGEYILKNLSFPRYDFYSYTAEGNFWFNPHWLFQVFIYLIHRFWGFAGIIIIKTIVILISFIILFRIGYRRENYLWYLVFLTVVILTAKDRFAERPEFASFLFLAVYLAIIHSYRYKRTKFIFILPFLQILWTNTHVFSFVGLGIIFIYLFGDFIGTKLVLPLDWNKNESILKGRDYILLWKVFLLCILASAINPYGIRIFTLPFHLAGFMANHREILVGGIVELVPTFTRTSLFAPGYFYYKILIILTLATFIIRFRRIDFSYLILYIAFLFLSLIAVRNIVLFSLVVFPIITDNMQGFIIRLSRTAKSGAIKITKFLLSSSAVVYIFYTVFFFTRETLLFSYYTEGRIEKRFGLGLSSFFPKNAVDFIMARDIKGNIFNSFKFGSYFVYRAYPERKVFIDGRTGVYGDDFLRYYSDVHFYPANFEHLVNKFDINYFLLDINAGGLFRRLYLDKQNWRLVFFDLNGCVFVKNIPEFKSLIEEYEVDLEKLPLDPEGDYSKFKMPPYPISCFIKGEVFYNLGLSKRAKEEYRLGLRVNPQVAGLYNNIGIIYQEEGKIEEAIELYNKALELDPHLVNASINLGSIYQARGELDKALEIYKRVLPPFNMPNALVYNHMGDIYRQQGLLRKALASYAKAIALEPLRYEFHYNRGLVLADMGKIHLALGAFRKARDLQPALAIIYNNLGACYMTLKKYERAKREFRRALDIEPDLAEAKSNLEKLKKLMEEEHRAPEHQ